MTFQKVREQYDAGDDKAALALLEQLHHEWHDSPREHVLIHWWQARIAWRCQRYRRAAWEMFALIFAAPTSLVQKYFGLVRKNI